MNTAKNTPSISDTDAPDQDWQWELLEKRIKADSARDKTAKALRAKQSSQQSESTDR